MSDKPREHKTNKAIRSLTPERMACGGCGHGRMDHHFHHRFGERHPKNGTPVHCDGIDAGYVWSECLCPGFVVGKP